MGRPSGLVPSSAILACVLALSGAAWSEPATAAEDAAKPAAIDALSLTTGSVCQDRQTTDVDLQWLIDLRSWQGPQAIEQGINALNELAVACYGANDLVLTAFMAAPEGLGGTVPYYLDPPWLDTWIGSPARFLAVSDGESEPGVADGPFLGVAVPPALQGRFDGFAGRWVVVTLHFDDPSAATCTVAGPGAIDPGTIIPTGDQVIQLCRTSPVVSAIKAYVCPARPTTLRAIAAIPEPVRAHCLGSGGFSFAARGYSVNNHDLGIARGADWGPWRLSSSDGKARLEVFVPSSVELPDPVGTPWEGRDGVGGEDVWWNVVGHFDDPASTGCKGGGPDSLEYADVTLTIERYDPGAEQFCRDHFVVDRLTWLRVPPTDAAGTVLTTDRTAGAWLTVLAALAAFALVISRASPGRSRRTD